MEHKEEVRLIQDKQEIDKVIQEKIKNRKIIFTEYYKWGLLKKGISEDRFNEIFHQFDKVIL